MSLKINFIGAGKLGKNIAKLLVMHNAATIQGICNQSLESANKAVAFIGQGEAFPSIAALPEADVTFITTPDDCIQTCCEKLTNFRNGSIVAHCSGSLSSDLLNSAREKGCRIASVHPMKSFANLDMNISEQGDTYCTIEGDRDAVTTLSALFNTIGYLVYPNASRKKTIYHAAGVFASNYLVTLYETALRCLKEAGVEDEIATKIIINLMKNTLSNLEATQSAEKSLTGPIKRGDVETIKKHLHALSEVNLSELYKILGLTTADIACLPQDKRKEIIKILSTL